jgi:hypothetical protein
VTATNADNGAKLTTFTDQAGRYHFFGVTPGRYTMTASVAGFKETTVNNLSLGDAQSVQDFTLEFGAIQREVTPAGCGQRSYSWCRLLHRTK